MSVCVRGYVVPLPSRKEWMEGFARVSPAGEIGRGKITRLSAIGDCILTMPVACAIREAFPNAYIAWMTQGAGATLLHNHPAVDEVIKAGFNNIYQYKNHDSIGFMDRILSNTIQGFSKYVAKIKPDLIVVHGDRVEALAGAIVGSLNNILKRSFLVAGATIHRSWLRHLLS